MQWLIDIIIEAVKTDIGYIYRGDPATQDFEVGDFTQDATWHDLTLPAVVPINARLVHLQLTANATATNKVIQIKRAGNVNDVNMFARRTHLINVRHHADFSVSMQSGTRDIQYLTSISAFQRLDLSVKGWWL